MQKTNLVRSSDFFSLASRLLTSAIFIGAGISKLQKPEQTAQYMKSKNLPVIPVLSRLAAGVEILGGTGLLLGYHPRAAATALFGFLIPTTLIFHNFWSVEGQEREMQQVNFLKNLAVMGSLVQVFSAGPGKFVVSKSSWMDRVPSPLRHAQAPEMLKAA